MKKILRSFVFIMLINIACSDSGAVFSLEDLEWNNRVLIISGDENENDIVEQLNLFKNKEYEILDRDLVIISPVKNQLQISYDGLKTYQLLDKESSRTISDKYSLSSFKIILIGKDGGVKFSSKNQTQMNNINSIIDAMPMRQQEMLKG
tara:strand:+ start:1044 stop:1490 length:447 start_codon:yes stop_codon:yes gene_type:complete